MVVKQERNISARPAPGIQQTNVSKVLKILPGLYKENVGTKRRTRRVKKDLSLKPRDKRNFKKETIFNSVQCSRKVRYDKDRKLSSSNLKVTGDLRESFFFH